MRRAAEIATSAKPCHNASGCLAGLRCKFSSAGRGFLPKVGSAALSKSCSGLKIPCSGEAFVTGRTAAALATTQRAGNTSACFVNKMETNCSLFIPLYFLLLRIWFRWFYTQKTHWKLHLEKTSEAFNLRPNQRTCVRRRKKPSVGKTLHDVDRLKVEGGVCNCRSKRGHGLRNLCTLIDKHAIKQGSFSLFVIDKWPFRILERRYSLHVHSLPCQFFCSLPPLSRRTIRFL